MSSTKDSEVSEPPTKRQKTQAKVTSFFVKKATPSKTVSDSNANSSSAVSPYSLHAAFEDDDVSWRASSGTYDLGLACRYRDNFTDEDRINILQKKWTAPNSYVFPKDSNNRRYSKEWETKYSWLRYSQSTNGAYCAVCVCFATGLSNTELITKPFNDWKNACGKKRGTLCNHDQSDGHEKAAERAQAFQNICSGKEKPVKVHLSQAYAQRVENNRQALLGILDVILSLAKRGIALRGNWCHETHEEHGNFNFFLKWKAQHDGVLAQHLKSAPKNAKYISPQIQNELIEAFATTLRGDIIAEAMKGDFYSIMADETCDIGHVEQLSLCIRYLRMNKNGATEVTEDFLGFVELPETNSATISDAMLRTLTKWGVDLGKWRGKGFDGASTMSGHVSGVTTRIQNALPKAKYFTHCRNHCLNLVIVNSCQSVPEVRNFMDSLKDMTVFINFCAKRKYIFKVSVSDKGADDFLKDLAPHEQELLTQSNRRQGIPTLSDTRWLARIDAISTLLIKYEQIFDALTNIAEKSNGQPKHDANSFLKRMSEFSYIISAVMTQYVLAFIRPLSVALQSKECDLVKAHRVCQTLLLALQHERTENTFNQLYLRACTILRKCFGEDQEPEVPRSNARKRQKHRANAPSTCPEEYYRINYYYPFLDHVVAHLEKRFPTQLSDIMLASYLMPSKLDEFTDEMEKKLLDTCQDDLPMPESLTQEIKMWKIKHKDNISKHETTFTDVLNNTSKAFFPNIHRIFSLLLTLPVGSCTCERSFSALRRLKTWCRTSIKEDKLNGLALAHIHMNHPLLQELEPERILKAWDATMSRRIYLAFNDPKETFDKSV